MYKQNLVILLLISSTPLSGMKIHAYLTNLLKDPIPTEYTAYNMLQQYPIKQEVNYLAVPWTTLINRRQLHKVPTIKLNGGFTICQHIYYEQIIPILREIGIDVLFTPHVPHNKTYDGIKVLPFPHYPVNGIGPAKEKNVIYSFIGFSSHQVRTKIFSMRHPRDTIIKKRSRWHFGSRQKEREKKEYQSVLARSRFSLCPRGTGASTVRFWESLQAGAIPVVLSDVMSLPEGFDWDSCVIRIDEKDVYKIPEIIVSILPEQERYMREQCYKVFEKFCNNNFVYTIHKYYEND